MSAVALLEEAHHLGLRISIRGENLHIDPAPDPEVLNRIKAVKPDLMRALKIEAAATEAVKGLSGYITEAELLAKLAPEDVTELEAATDPLPFLRSFTIACVWTAFRRDGIVPPGWDKPAHCAHCGTVFLWATIHVSGCPWCWNRCKGLKIPRPRC